MDTVTRAKLKRLVQSSDWEVIYAFKAWMNEQWAKGEVKVDDEFNTFWNLATREGKKNGLEEFINCIERVALDSND